LITDQYGASFWHTTQDRTSFHVALSAERGAGTEGPS